MEFDLKDCLFVGVDMQRSCASKAPGRAEAVAQIESLRVRLKEAEVPHWQIASRPEPVPVYMTGAIREREMAQRSRDHELLFKPTAGEFVHWKQSRHMPSDTYIDTMQRQRPQAVVFYGWFLEECVLSCAVQAEKFLHIVQQVAVLRDCGAQRTPGIDLASVRGDRISLIDSQQVQIENGKVILPGDPPMRHRYQADRRPALRR